MTAIEKMAQIPVEVDVASEFRYRDPFVDEKTLFIAISQSGETLDTLAALREAKRKGAECFPWCNVVGSSVARESTTCSTPGRVRRSRWRLPRPTPPSWCACT